MSTLANFPDAIHPSWQPQRMPKVNAHCVDHSRRQSMDVGGTPSCCRWQVPPAATQALSGAVAAAWFAGHAESGTCLADCKRSQWPRMLAGQRMQQNPVAGQIACSRFAKNFTLTGVHAMRSLTCHVDCACQPASTTHVRLDSRSITAKVASLGKVTCTVSA